MLENIRQQLALSLQQATELPLELIQSQLESPKQFSMGHFAFPVFALAKVKKQAPPVLAKELAEKLNSTQQPGDTHSANQALCAKIEAVGGFVNFTLTDQALQSLLWQKTAQPNSQLQDRIPEPHRPMNLVVEFSSPNVAKPMHVGHLRATVIGQALVNLARACGHKVTAINHLGDWGSQFGKLAWAVEHYLPEAMAEQAALPTLQELVDLYVRFHKEAEVNPELENQGALYFAKLENGDPSLLSIWQKIVKSSLTDYQRLYDLLGVEFDLVQGESFYADLLADVRQRLKTKNLLVASEGAQVVYLPEAEQIPPCIIQKSDGASIYATRDLAAALYRREVLGAERIVYVVGQDQTLHFRQVFGVLELMDPSWKNFCQHVSFGMYRFPEGKMSTRAGRTVYFEDVLNQAEESVTKIIEERNPTLPNRSQVAQQVAVGAVVFGDLVNDRVRNVEFDWDRMLSFDGDSGPYVLYTMVRCKSLLRKFAKEVPSVAPLVMSEPEAQQLVFTLLRFSDVVHASFAGLKPNLLAQYLLELCGHFNSFYHHHRILGEEAQVELTRMRLVDATAKILEHGLRILNITAPEAM